MHLHHSSVASDVQSLAMIDDTLPLKSPSRMVALQLANSNPAFREKLKKKLEASGVTFEIDEATGIMGSLAAAASSSSSSSSTNGRKPPVKGSKAAASMVGGLESDPYVNKSATNKMRQKRKASSVGGESASSIMRRRRKQELEIAVTGTAAHIHPGGPIVSGGGTPFRSLGFSYSGVPGTGTVSPLNVEKHVNFGDDFYSTGGLGSLGNLISLPIGDTPGKPLSGSSSFMGSDGSNSGIKNNDSSRSSASTPRFDFDEVLVQSFPSPRGSAGGMVGASPNRWSIGSSAGSINSMFIFPDSSAKAARPGSSSSSSGNSLGGGA
jgi:hypothetical protein